MNSSFKLMVWAYFLCFAMSLSGQGWIKRYHVGNVSEGTAIHTLSDNNLVIVGRNFEPYNVISPVSGYIMMVDEFGSEIWSKQISAHAFSDVISIEENGYLVSTGVHFQNNTTKGIFKYSSQGEKEWEFQNNSYSFRKIEKLPNGNILGVGLDKQTFSGYPKSIFLELSDDGTPVFEYHFIEDPGDGGSDAFCYLSVDQGYYIGGIHTYPGSSKIPILALISSDGNYIFQQKLNDTGTSSKTIGHIKKIDNNSLLLVLESYHTLYDDCRFGAPRLIKVNLNGEIIWNKDILSEEDPAYLSFLDLNNGNVLITGNDCGKPVVAEYDLEGELVWKRVFDFENTLLTINSAFQNEKGELFFTGKDFTQEDDKLNFPVLIKTDSVGNIYSNYVEGKAFLNSNWSCVAKESDPPIKGFNINFHKNGEVYSTTTDESGKYQILLDTGAYHISLSTVSPFWSEQPCFDGSPLVLDNFYETTTLDLGHEALVECPLIQVDMTNAIFRRCFESIVNIKLTNIGASTIEPFTFDLYIPEEVELVSSSINASQINDFYRYEIGSMDILDNLNIQLSVIPDCDAPLASTHCFDYQITAADSCLYENIDYDGSNLKLDANCDESEVTFSITNAGNSMLSESHYKLYGENILIDSATVFLSNNETLFIEPNSNHDLYELKVAQVENHPGLEYSELLVQNCGTFDFYKEHTADVFEYGIPQEGQTCFSIIGSFDPNDKILKINGDPTEAECYEYSDQFEYTIRFQNTGNDTAFTVQIIDTLSNLYNLPSLEIVGSSHPFNFSIESNRILNFKFPNILLPDSTTNEIESHGYITYIIKPDYSFFDQNDGSLLENRAAIYFDFNPPVITEWNSIEHCQMPNGIDNQQHADKLNNFRCFPNPTLGSTFIQSKENNFNSILKIYDSLGRLVFQKQLDFTSGNTSVDISFLSNGLLFFELIDPDGKKETHKILKTSDNY